MSNRSSFVCATVSFGAGMLCAIRRRDQLTAALVSALKAFRWAWSKPRLDSTEADATLLHSSSLSTTNAPMLSDSTQNVISMLRTRHPKSVEGVPAEKYELPPHIPKSVWEDLGCLVRAQENSKITVIPGNKWISLRLDGCGFSKQTRALRRLGVLDAGYSEDFGEIMKECVKLLMETFHGCLGYTQSDEMTVLIHPASVVRGEQQCHHYGGRIQKLCSTAASTVTAHFNRRVFQLAEKRGIVPDECFPLSHFDCRVGTFESKDEALALVLWRANDCGVNGVSDAVHQIEGAGKKIKGCNRTEKLAWLADQSRLPLPAHQAYGSLFLHGYSMVEGMNPKTGERTTAMRRRISQANNGESGGALCVLNLMAQGKLSLAQHRPTVKTNDAEQH